MRSAILKSLGALSGLAILLLILFIPSLPNLAIISMLLCLVGFAYVGTVSLAMNSAEREEGIKKFQQLRRERIRGIANDILHPEQNLGDASLMTLERDRDTYKLLSDAAFQGGNFQQLMQNINQNISSPDNNPVSFVSLPPFAKRALKSELDRLLDVQLTAEPEDNATIVGIGGIFGIIGGLGIAEALITYFGSLAVNGTSTSTSLFQIVNIDWSYTYRIVGFLAMILPFIHGFIITITAKWYHEPITDTYHFRLALVFFIAVLIHTVLFFLLAEYVEKVSFYILYLWSIFIFNILWLLIQSALTYEILKRTDTFLHEWIIINFITVAYLSVFVFAYPSLLGDNSATTAGKDVCLNLQIALVLVIRTVSDYTVGWKKVYNKETK